MPTHRKNVQGEDVYVVVGHNCHSDNPDFRDPGKKGCEHVRIDSGLNVHDARKVVDLMDRLGLDPSVFMKK